MNLQKQYLEMLEDWLSEKLEDRRQKGLLRILPGERHLVDFASNDYMGLSRHEGLYHRIKESLALLPKRNGSTGSRLLSGDSALAAEVENKLARIFKSKASLLFNSGYSANLAVLSSLPQKDDTVFYDELSHASIKDGIRLSLAKKYSFRHNDLADLEKKIAKSTGRIFVVVESIYSMDGDECPLADLIKLSEKHNFSVILDEAHSTGVTGPGGAGLCVAKALQEKVDVRIYTFGKGMGVCGACVAGSENLIRYLVNYARPFIYTTAPSPHTIASINCAFDFLSENLQLQETLQGKIERFVETAGVLANRTKSVSAIQTLIVPGSDPVRKAAKSLQHDGFDVRPIVSPTVPRGTERLRICLHVYNGDHQIESLAKALIAISGA